MAANAKLLPSDLRAVVFDVDGTLYRLEGLQRAVQLHYLLGHWHRPRECWHVDRVCRAHRRATDALRDGPPDGMELGEAQVRVASQKSGLPEDFVRKCSRRWMMEEPLRFFLRYRYEGVREVLAELRESGLKLAVFSDFQPDEKLCVLELGDLFDVAISAHDPEVQRFKPDPRGLQVTLERLGVAANQSVYVGDRSAIDGEAARRAGLAFLAAGEGYAEPRESFWRLRNIFLARC